MTFGVNPKFIGYSRPKVKLRYNFPCLEFVWDHRLCGNYVACRTISISLRYLFDASASDSIVGGIVEKVIK